MLSYLKKLAQEVDELSLTRRVSVIETAEALALSNLCACDAARVIELLAPIGWPHQIVDSAGETAESSTLNEDYEPFNIYIQKKSKPSVLCVVTLSGFAKFLESEDNTECWEVVRLNASFSSMASIFVPWGVTEVFSPAGQTKGPRSLVKEHSSPLRAPRDIRVWLPKSAVTPELWLEPVFRVFADLSARAMMNALAGEIALDGGLVYRGPPQVRLCAPVQGERVELDMESYNSLRSAAAWVFESETEAELRHGLFIAEFARCHKSDNYATQAFANGAASALDGARLAYQLSLSDLTREAIKAQGDLRKAVADDTAKLADNTRQVVMAVAAALATCAGLVAAKVGTSTPGWMLQIVAVIAAIYVAAIVASGWNFLVIQKSMRESWRDRLYKFVPDEDYAAMVNAPASRAEFMFILAAIAGGVVSTLAIIMVLMLCLHS